MTRRRRVMLMSFSLDLGGSERQLTEVARSLDPEYFEVHVGCQVAKGIRIPELKSARIPVVEFPMSSYASIGGIRSALALRSYIRTHGIDLVHAFDVPMDIFAVPVARVSGCPAVLSSQRAHRSLTTGARLTALRALDRLTDGIVVNCEFIRQHLVRDENVSPEKIHLCFNGLDPHHFRPQPRDRCGSDGTLTIGTVAGLRPEKNIPLLLRAFARLRAERSDTRLLVVGGGPCESDVRKLAQELELGPDFRLAPPAQDVTCWMHRIDIFVLPSKTEAFSNSIMEAMACGCAVAASKVGGNPELTGLSEERGLLFESDDEIGLYQVLQRLVADASLRTTLASQASHYVRTRLSIETSVRRMAGIYSAVLN